MHLTTKQLLGGLMYITAATASPITTAAVCLAHAAQAHGEYRANEAMLQTALDNEKHYEEKKEKLIQLNDQRNAIEGNIKELQK